MFDPEQQEVTLGGMEIEMTERHRPSSSKPKVIEEDYRSPTPDLRELTRLLNPFREEPATPELTVHTKNLVIYIAIFGLIQTLYVNLRTRLTVIQNELTEVDFMALYFAGVLGILVVTVQIRGLLIKTNEWIIVLILYLIYTYINYFFTFGFAYQKFSVYRRVSHTKFFNYMEFRIAGLGLFISTSSVVGFALLLFMGLTSKFINPRTVFLINIPISFLVGVVWIYPGSWEKEILMVHLMNLLASVGVSLLMSLQVKYINAKLRNGTDYNFSECIYLALVGRFRGIMTFVVFVLRAALDIFCAIFYY